MRVQGARLAKGVALVGVGGVAGVAGVGCDECVACVQCVECGEGVEGVEGRTMAPKSEAEASGAACRFEWDQLLDRAACGFGFRISGFGFRVQGVGCWAWYLVVKLD